MIQSVVAEALIRLRLIDEANTNKIDRAKRKIDDAKKSTDKLKKAGDDAGRSFHNLSFEMRSIAIVMGAIGAATIGFVSKSIKEFADFEFEMASVRAVTGATDLEMSSLSETILNLGAQTQYYSTQVAETAKQMGQMGLTAKEVAGILPEVLSLATIENLDPKKAAQVVVGAAKALAEPLEYIGKLADLLAFAASSSATTVEEMGRSLAISGAAAKAAGQSFETTLSILMTLADRNIRAAKSGQAYVMILNRLTKAMGDMRERTTVQGELMKKFGIELDSGSGKIKNVIDILLQLKRSGMDSIDMLTIFGDRTTKYVETLMPAIEHTAAINRLLEENAELYKGLNERMKELKMDSVKGDVLKMASVFKNLTNVMGESVANAFREVIQKVTDLVEKGRVWAKENPELASSIMMVAAGVGILASAIAVASVATFAFSIAGGPLIWILTGVMGVATAGAIAWKNWVNETETATESSKRAKESFTTLESVLYGFQTALSAIMIAAKVLWATTIGDLIDSIKTLVFWLGKIPFVGKVWEKIKGFIVKAAEATNEFNEELSWKGGWRVLEGSASATGTWGDAVGKTREEIEKLNETLKKNKEEIEKNQEATKGIENLQTELRRIFSEATTGTSFMTEGMFKKESANLETAYKDSVERVKAMTDDLFNFGASKEDVLSALFKKYHEDLADLNKKMFGEDTDTANEIANTYQTMYEVLKFDSEKYYNHRLDLLEKQREEEINVTKDIGLAWEVYYARLKELDRDRIRHSGSAMEGVKLFFEEESEKPQSWATEVSGGLGDLKSAMSEAATSIVRQTNTISGAFENMAMSILDSIAKIGTNMMVNALFSSIGGMIGGASLGAGTSTIGASYTGGAGSTISSGGGVNFNGITGMTGYSRNTQPAGDNITNYYQIDATDADSFAKMLKRNSGVLNGITVKGKQKSRNFEKSMR